MGTDVHDSQGHTFALNESKSLSFDDLTSLFDAFEQEKPAVSPNGVGRIQSGTFLPTFGSPGVVSQAPNSKEPIEVKNFQPCAQEKSNESTTYVANVSGGAKHVPLNSASMSQCNLTNIASENGNSDDMGNYLVVRNPPVTDHQPTFSFGEPTETRIIEVVNHYKPGHGARHTSTYRFNGQGRKSRAPRGHVGGDSTASSMPRWSDVDTPTSQLPRRCEGGGGSGSGAGPGAEDEDEETGRNYASDYDATPNDGLFEVPLVCAMPRLVNSFLGFTRIYTQRAIRFLHFVKKDGALTCNLENDAYKLLKSQVKNHKVVVISICGDSKSGKSYLASMLVDKPGMAFMQSENTASKNDQGTVWLYAALYKDKYAYIFLDFDGFDNSPQDRGQMLTFAFTLSDCVICNVQNPPMTGLYEFIEALNFAVARPIVTEIGDDEDDEIKQEGEDEEPDPSEPWDLKKAASLYFKDSRDFGKIMDRLDSNCDQPSSQAQGYEHWHAPILNFVFRDCDGFIRGVDDQLYTPETLVEQGIFDHYANIFNCHQDSDIKNAMLDSFGIFTNRKYTCLPFPVDKNAKNSNNILVNLEKNLAFYRNVAKNARGALERVLTNFLAPENNRRFILDVNKYQNDNDLLNGLVYNLKPNLALVPPNMMSTLFLERVDDIKSTVYNDVMCHAKSYGKLKARMFGTFARVLITRFNSQGFLTRHDVDPLINQVYTKENQLLAHDVSVSFLKDIKRSVVAKMPLDPRDLLTRCMDVKHRCIARYCTLRFGFETDGGADDDDDNKGSNTPSDDKTQANLEASLQSIIAKLEDKNEKMATESARSMLSKCVEAVELKIQEGDYKFDDLTLDISKLCRMFDKKYKGHVDLRRDMVGEMIHNLFDLYRAHYPDEGGSVNMVPSATASRGTLRGIFSNSSVHVDDENDTSSDEDEDEDVDNEQALKNAPSLRFGSSASFGRPTTTKYVT